MTNGYKVSIHVETLEEAQTVQELALDAFGYPVTLCSAERDTHSKPVNEWRSGKTIIRHMQKDINRTYTSEDIGILLEENDFAGHSANAIMKKLVDAGLVKKLSAGTWRYIVL